MIARHARCADRPPAGVWLPEFRGLQAEIVAHVATGHHALVLMPTGGKVAVLSGAGLVASWRHRVVSPLIALMEDQVATLSELGVAAA